VNLGDRSPFFNRDIPREWEIPQCRIRKELKSCAHGRNIEYKELEEPHKTDCSIVVLASGAILSLTRDGRKRAMGRSAVRARHIP
jgi:hypothetical protein